METATTNGPILIQQSVVLDESVILTAKNLTLKPNKYLKDPTIPYLYQRRGILMMLVKPNCVLGDDVGLGKTLECIVQFTYLKAANPELKAIVFTEKSALRQWQNEFLWLTQGLTTKIITAETHEDKTLRLNALRHCVADILITTYSTILNYTDPLIEGRLPTYVLYADEPAIFKNFHTKSHKQMAKISDKAARRHAATATIIENRLEEGMAIFHITAPGQVMPMATFMQHHCIRTAIPGTRHFRTVGYKNLEAWRDAVSPFYFGRLQDDKEVLQQLPEVITKDVEITLGHEQSQLIAEATDKLLTLPSGKVQKLQLLQALTVAQKIINNPSLAGYKLNSPKLEALIEMIEGSLVGERVIVFSQYRTQVDQIGLALATAGLEFGRITGLETGDEREAVRARFMSDGVDRLNIILMTRAGQRAINLQKGAILIFYDLPWSYGAYRQNVGRIKRTGSLHEKVAVIRLMGVLHPDVAKRFGSDKTLDHYRLKVLMRKKPLFDLLTGDATTLETTDDDIQAVYEELKRGAVSYTEKTEVLQ